NVPSAASLAGETVEQNGHTRAWRLGSHRASPPQAGTAYLFSARSAAIAALWLQELLERGLRYAPGCADLPSLEVPGFEAGENIGLGHPERLGGFGRGEKRGHYSCSGARRTAR